MTSPSRNEYTANTWHQVTPGVKWTHFKHNLGNGTVVFTEAAVIPVGYDTDSPVTTETTKSDEVYFKDVNAGDSIWFYPIGENADLTITTVD